MTGRLFSFLGFLLLFVCLSKAERHTAWHPEERQDPWTKNWYHKRHEIKKKRAFTKDYDLVMMGDSITHGWEREGDKVWQAYYGIRNALNLGFDGDRTEHLLWRLQNGAMDNIEPKCVTLMLGTNNVGKRLEPPEVTFEAIKKILTMIRKRWPFCKVILIGILPRGKVEGDLMRSLVTRINKLLKTCADERTVYWLDFGEHFLTNRGELRVELMPDYVHPNEKGYKIWAEAMEPLLKKILP